MERKHILFLTIFPQRGGGYSTVSAPICDALVDAGYDVKMIALDNFGEEHNHKFSILPTRDLTEARISIGNLNVLWGVDLVIAAMDLPLQENMLESPVFETLPYMVITPLENGPLIKSVAMNLAKAVKVFFISQLAVREAAKVVLKSDHLPVEVDTDLWKPATPERKLAIRKNLGFEPDDYIILTVAENQERKNPAAAIEAVGLMKKMYPGIKKFKYLMVSTEYHPTEHNVGNRLFELAVDNGLKDEFILYNKGIPKKELVLLYQAADTFLLTSKAEGLGLPVLEAMSCDLNIVATNTGALTELLDMNRGWLIDPAYSFTDVWMNSKRDMFDIESGARALSYAHFFNGEKTGRDYVLTLKGLGSKQVIEAVEEILCKA